MMSKVPGLSNGLSKIPSALGLPGGMPGTDALGKIGQTFGNFKLPGVSDVVNKLKSNLPDGFRQLPTGQGITDRLLEGAGKFGIKMPSSVGGAFDQFKDKFAGLTNNLPEVGNVVDIGKKVAGGFNMDNVMKKANDFMGGPQGLGAIQTMANSVRFVTYSLRFLFQ
jgi:hypothetical protein